MSATQTSPATHVDTPPTALKVLIAGGFGVGKTTAVASISEIEPLRTDGSMTDVAILGSLGRAAPDKVGTTVALDFGRVTLDDGTPLYLFGTPGQERFAFMWDELARGAVAALVVVDTRRLACSFPAIDACERNGIPFAIAINQFDGIAWHTVAEVREAVAVGEDVPVVTFDARQADQVRAALSAIVASAAEPDRAESPSGGAEAGDPTAPIVPV